MEKTTQIDLQDHTAYQAEWISLAYFEEVADGDSDLMRELVNLFIMRVPHEMAEIKKQVQAQDLKKLEKALHSAAPNFRYVCLRKAEQLIEDLRNKIKGQNIELGYLHGCISQLEAMSESAVEQAKRQLQLID